MIEMEGLPEWSNSLRRMHNKIPATLNEVAKQAANWVEQTTKPTIPRDTGKAIESLQVFVTDTGAALTGGVDIHYYRWLELGGLSGVHHSVKRSESDGRYIHPAYEREKAKINKLLALSMIKLLKEVTM